MKVFSKYHLFKEFLFLSFNIHTNEMKFSCSTKYTALLRECCGVINQLPNRPWPVAIHHDISEFNIPLAQKYFSTMNKITHKTEQFPSATNL